METGSNSAAENFEFFDGKFARDKNGGELYWFDGADVFSATPKDIDWPVRHPPAVWIGTIVNGQATLPDGSVIFTLLGKATANSTDAS